MKFLSLLSLLISLAFTLHAQEGSPLLTHFKESREVEDQNWAICQDANNVMFFANRKGVLSFDGQEWHSIRVPIIPFSMQANPADRKIFIGGENNFGFLDKESSGLVKYTSLSGDTSQIGDITRIIFRDSLAFFYSEKTVNRYNLESGILELRVNSETDYPFSGIIVTEKNTFVNVYKKGLFIIGEEGLSPVSNGKLTGEVYLLFSLPYSKNEILVGQSDGRLSIFDGSRFRNYPINDEGYLRESILSDGICIGDSLYAFSTLDGGALVVRKNSGKIRYTINYQNDLPDDEIFAIGQDKSGGLWLSHQYGLTRADMNLPIGNFSTYPGLEGNLTTALWHNNELYVATSEGVFYLSKVQNYSEIKGLEKKEPVKSARSRQSANTDEAKNKRENIFTRIFSRRTKEGEDAATVPTTNPSSKTSPAVKRKIISINYFFKKTKGINEKCRQLVSTKNGILAATNQGLYLINNHSATLIEGNHYINFISWQPSDNGYLVAADDGYFSVMYTGGRWLTKSLDPLFKDPVYSIIETKNKTRWIGVDNAALRIESQEGSDSLKYRPVIIKNDFPQRYNLNYINDSIFLNTAAGIYYYDEVADGFAPVKNTDKQPSSTLRFSYPLSNAPWAFQGDDWISLGQTDSLVDKEKALLKIFNDVISINSGGNFIWLVEGENRLYRIDLNQQSGVNPDLNILVKGIYNKNGTTFDLSKIIFDKGNELFHFSIIVPGYLNKNTTQYQYFVNKLMSGWSSWSYRTDYDLLIPKSGRYTLNVRAKDLWGNVGEIKSIEFRMRIPFTQSTLFYILIIVMLFGVLFLVSIFRTQRLQKLNKILEDKVTERTAKIETQKREITSSIEYASRIQRAILPLDDLFKKSFPDYFIFYKPKDIVSGDFYWIDEDDKNIYITVADCTGHGVPGALMSALGISLLNEIVAHAKAHHANTILSLLREKIKTVLHQRGKEGEAVDGMDAAFCVLNKNRKTLQFSGAFNPLFIFQKGEFKEYKADRMPIGIYYGEKDAFTNYEINLKKGDVFYLFTDGFSDQFGGPEDLKFKKSRLKKLLSEIHYMPMKEQQRILERKFETWRGSADQVDDVTVIGMKI